MPFSITSNFEVTSADPLDFRYGPYATTDQATGSIDFRQRHLGLTVMITGSGTSQEYWFFPNTSSLNPKTGSGGTADVTNNNDNYVLTGTGTGIQGEANLQFNGNVLSVTGSIEMSAGTSTSGITGSLFGTASFATTASFANLIEGPGIKIRGMEISASVRSVNGQLPDANTGNVAVSLSTTYTGFSSSLSGAPSLQASSSGNITASFGNGSLWVVIGETDPQRTGSNGQTFIFTSGSVGSWVLVPNASQAANDSRYVLKAGDTMTGNLTMGSGAKLIGTASAADISFNTILSQSLKPNIGAGGISANRAEFVSGSSIEALLRELLITYVPATVSAFSLEGSNITVLNSDIVREVGHALAFDDVVFTATADNPNGRFPMSASFTASGAGSGNFNQYLVNAVGSNNDLDLGSQSVNNSQSGSVTFTLNTRNPLNSSALAARTRTITYVHPIICGLSEIDYFNNQSNQLSQDANLDKLVEVKGNKNVDFGAGGEPGYIIFAYPSSYGALTTSYDQNNFPLDFTGDYHKFDLTNQNKSSGGINWSGVTYTVYQRKIVSSPQGIYKFNWTA
jgi:hypothetical protein